MELKTVTPEKSRLELYAKIHCPECGEENRYFTTDVERLTLNDVSLKQWAINGSSSNFDLIFNAACPYCGKNFLINHTV